MEWTFLCKNMRTEDGNKVLIQKKHRLKGVRYMLKTLKEQMLFDHCENIDNFLLPGEDIFGFNLLHLVMKFCFNLGYYSRYCFVLAISLLLCTKPTLPV